MKTALLILGAGIVLWSAVPYVRDILKGRSRPNVVSWVTWCLLAGIATAAEIDAHEYATAVFSGALVVQAASILLLGLRYGYAKYTKLDVVCQIGAIIGIVLWQIFNSPLIGVLASVIIDFIAAVPTLHHSWVSPREETWQTYALSNAASVLTIFALSSFNWVSLTYPIYIVLIDTILPLIIILRGRVLATAQGS